MQTNSKKDIKKVGILTFHFPYNVGAMLQCYALQQQVNKFAKCKVISYEPFSHGAYYNYWAFPKWKYKKIVSDNPNASLKIKVKALGNALKISFDKNAKKIRREAKPFTRFLKKIKRTKVYFQQYELKTLENEFDLFIVGSDQVWNTNIIGEDTTYFLEFVSSSNKKASYALSAGDTISQEKFEKFLPLIKDFKHLSAREKSLQNQLIAEDLNCKLVVDPTLLLSKEDYKKIESNLVVKGKYILVYSFCYSKELEEILVVLREKYNCKVIVFTYVDDAKLLALSDEKVEYSIGNFLKLISGAEFVVTNSFHGTAFSLIYGKKFVCLPAMITNSRIVDFLNEFEKIYKNAVS